MKMKIPISRGVAEWAAVTSDFAIEAPIAGHHLFVYDEAARASWLEAVAKCLDMVAPKLLREYVVTGKNGAALRAGSELTTAQVEPELARGTSVLVCEEALNSAGKERVHLVSYETPGGPKVPIDAWASKKLFEFKKVATVQTPPSPPLETTAAAAVAPPPAPSVVSQGLKKKYVVTGKNGAMVRAGCELESADVHLTLAPGSECYGVEERANAKGTARVHLVLYSPKGEGPYEAMDGWCTAKFLTCEAEGTDIIIPAAGTVPFQRVFPKPVGEGPVATVVLFPGQGAQKVGMMAPYVEAPGVRAMFDRASEVFGGCDLLNLTLNGPVDQLNDTQFSQVCVFLTSLAAMKKLEAEDPAAVASARVCAGFSLGEYTALTFAGVMDLDTAVRLLKVRGEAMAAACALGEPSGMMTVVGLDEAALSPLLAKHGVGVANQLFPKGRVLSGSKAGLEALKAEVDALNAPGTKTIVQPVSGAFHSPFMAPAAAQLKAALADATFHKPSRVVYSNVTARPHSADPEAIKEAMEAQLVSGVLWEDTMTTMAEAYPDVAKFVEPAPGKQLSSMMRRIEPKNVPKMLNL